METATDQELVHTILPNIKPEVDCGTCKSKSRTRISP